MLRKIMNDAQLPNRIGLYRRLRYGEIIRQRNNRIYGTHQMNQNRFDNRMIIYGRNNMLEQEQESLESLLTLRRVNEMSDVRLYKSIYENELCTICQEQFENNQIIRELKCRHIYHIKCIDTWLCIQTKCPLCNLNINK